MKASAKTWKLYEKEEDKNDIVTALFTVAVALALAVAICIGSGICICIGSGSSISSRIDGRVGDNWGLTMLRTSAAYQESLTGSLCNWG